MDVPDTDGLIQAKDDLERHMESLYQEALELANSFFEFTRAMNQNMDWPKKSSLQLRVRQRGLSGRRHQRPTWRRPLAYPALASWPRVAVTPRSF